MSWKSFACLAAIGAMASPAAALTSISASDDSGTNTGTITIGSDTAGSLAAELYVFDLTGDLVITGATINPFFDDENPGDSPFVGGAFPAFDAPEGGDATGVVVEVDGSGLFAAYGGPSIDAETTQDYLTFTYTGSGTADIAGIVAQGGLLGGQLLLEDVEFGSTVVENIWDFEPDGDVDIIDFGNFADAFNNGAPLPGTNGYGDGEPDGDVDIIDFGNFADAFNASQNASSTIPEPTTIVLGLIGLACLGARRSV